MTAAHGWYGVGHQVLVCVSLCTYAHVYVYVCVCTYIHIYMEVCAYIRVGACLLEKEWRGNEMQDTCLMIKQKNRLRILCGEYGITHMTHHTGHFQSLECRVLRGGWSLRLNEGSAVVVQERIWEGVDRVEE